MRFSLFLIVLGLALSLPACGGGYGGAFVDDCGYYDCGCDYYYDDPCTYYKPASESAAEYDDIW